jgi:hypothetical protein
MVAVAETQELSIMNINSKGGFYNVHTWGIGYSTGVNRKSATL